MFATTRWATKSGLAKFLLTGAILLVGSSGVYADTINLSFDNVNPGMGIKYTSNGNNANSSWSDTTAGQFNWTRNSGVTYLGNPTVTTFCIELGQVTGSNINYTIVSDLSGLPLPGNGMGADAAKQIQTLANGYANGQANSLLDLAMNFTITTDMIQSVIWNLSREGDFSTTAGNFRISDQNNPNNNDSTWEQRVNQILGWVSSNWNNYNANTATWVAVGLTNGNNQDQIDFIHAPTGGVPPAVPVPASFVLASLGVLCMGGFNLLRRRTAIATA